MQNLTEAAREHWPEYLMEAGCLGAFMVSACLAGVALDHPLSPLHRAIESAFWRGALGGVAMGVTAICIFLSPWGKRSGAHMNPAVTLTFLMLGKINRFDAFWYVVAQFAGGTAGVLLCAWILGPALGAVHYVATVPGPMGVPVAFAAELAISLLMMLTVLTVSNNKALHGRTPFFAATLVALYITFEAPLSGMSMNPARTFGSAVVGWEWNSAWIYFTAPVLGMLLAGFAYQSVRSAHRIFCAKLHHANDCRCIFHCNYEGLTK